MVIRTPHRLWWAGILLSLVMAGSIGWWRQQRDVQAERSSLFPQATQLRPLGDGLHMATVREGDVSRSLGWVSIGTAPGYAGPLRVAVTVTTQGVIEKVALLKQTESTAFFQKLQFDQFSARRVGQSCNEPFVVGQDIQAVTGATVSLQGVTAALRQACHRVAGHIQLPLPEIPTPSIVVGLPEVVLVLLYGAGFLAYLPAQTCRKVLHWVSLVLGLVLLGIWLNRPLALASMNSLLLGTWPPWRTHLYWYLLLGGVLLPVLLTGRNLYCDHVCPLGAVQEVLGAASGRCRVIPTPTQRRLHRVQRFLAWLSVVCALILRHPAKVQYEITGSLFSLTGAYWQFLLLATVLVTALFVARPWCHALCPIRAVIDYLRWVRRRFIRKKTVL